MLKNSLRVLKLTVCGTAVLSAVAALPASASAESQTTVNSQPSVSQEDIKLGSGATAPAASSMAQVTSVAAYEDGTKLGSGQSVPTANAMAQVTSVSQLSDVKPTDWAFQALQSLVERYGCIVGYPNKTYRGNQALSRYEFAAGLNACMDRINELIAAGTANLVKKEDLLAVQKLQEQFAAELATLRGRVDALDVRTATLEKQQFSTITKLTGEVIFTLADTFGDRAGGNTNNTNTIFGDRVRLYLDSSFSGKDNLHIGLQANNITSFQGGLTGTRMTRLGYDGSNNNSLGLFELSYSFPVGDKLNVTASAYGIELYDLLTTLSPLSSSGSGALSRFGRFNPIYRTTTNGTALVFNYKLTNTLNFEAAYQAGDSSWDPSAKNGLFDGRYKALGQFIFRPSKALSLGLTYAHAYYPSTDVSISGATGSEFAIAPFGPRPTSADEVSGQVQYKLSPTVFVGGWFGAFFAKDEISGQGATILTGSGYVALRDLGKKGSLAALLVGVPPKVTSNDNAARADRNTSIHVEALYRYPVTDHLAITPGAFVIFDPEHNSNNATQVVGVIRATFKF
jgi:hypothetical protein